MNQNNSPYILGRILLLMLIWALNHPYRLIARPVPEKQGSGKSAQRTERLPAMDINQVRAWLSNQGVLFQSSTTGPGLEWPINSGKNMAFLMAPWLSCQFAGDSSDIRTAAVRNIIDGSEFIPGKIIQNPDSSLSPDNPNLNRYRLYRIQRGDNANSNPDYRDWPFEDGAPYEVLQKASGGDSLDAFGQLVPKLDNSGNRIPKILGDQTVWCVYNDLRQDGRIFSTSPMGCEIRQTAFAFRQSGPLGQVVFFKFEITNKHLPDPTDPDKGLWKNAYFGLFSDHDVGELSDDLVGCDTILGLGFTYNASNTDQVYGSAPPAVGIDFFQGPIVPDGLSNDTLQATGFVRFNNTVDAPDADPQSGRPGEVYNYFRGLDRLGNPLPGMVTGSKFMYPGDPETEPASVYVEPTSEKNDKRQVLSAGPFDMAPGETQVVYCAVIVAQGNSNLNSVTRLKEIDRIAQEVFDSGFQLPSAPAPNLRISRLNKALVLDWLDSDPESPAYSIDLESLIQDRPGSQAPNDRYEFQGYVVYQYSGADGRQGSFEPIAVWDKEDGILEIVSETRAEINGELQDVVATVIKGSDSGVQRSMVVQTDQLNNESLRNGTRYYFGVSAYYVNPYQLAKSPYPDHPDPRTAPAYLESLALPVVATPQKPVAGTQLPYAPHQQIETNRYKFGGDNNVRIQVTDPLNLKAGRYEVKVLDEAAAFWQLFDLDINQVALNALSEPMDSLQVYPASASSVVPESFYGMTISVSASDLGTRRDAQGAPFALNYHPAANRFFQPKASGFSPVNPSNNVLTIQSQRMGNESASGAVWYPTKNLFTGSLPGSSTEPEDLKPVEIIFTQNPQKQQYAYRYVLNINPGNLDASEPLSKMIYEPAYATFIDTTGGVLEQKFKKSPEGPFQLALPMAKVPLQAFELDPNTGERLRQLQVLFTERNDPIASGGSIDGLWNPTASLSGGQELLCITASTYNPQSPDTTNATYRFTDQVLKTPRLFARDQDKLDIQYMLWIRAETGSGSKPRRFSEGDRLLITPNYKLSPSTVYAFEVKAIETGPDIAKSQLSEIGVFPNPYFGRSEREQNSRQTVVTFTNLPPTCTIRVFSLQGDLVREIRRKNQNLSSLEDWNLNNAKGVPVASGMYLVHIETPVGNKILKLAIVQRENRENYY